MGLKIKVTKLSKHNGEYLTIDEAQELSRELGRFEVYHEIIFEDNDRANVCVFMYEIDDLCDLWYVYKRKLEFDAPGRNGSDYRIIINDK